MSEMKIGAVSATAVDRRKLIGGMAMLGVASAVATPAMASFAQGDSRVRAFHARYALSNGKAINGFFAAPRGKQSLDVVLVMPSNDASLSEAVARSYAVRGYLAIAPDFAKAQGDASAGASRDAKAAELMRSIPAMKRMMRGSGRVAIVTA